MAERTGELSAAVRRLEQEIAERRLAEADLARSHRLVSALNRVFSRLQIGLDMPAVFEALGVALESENLTGLVLMVDAKTGRLSVQHASILPGALALYESLVGRPLLGSMLSADDEPFHAVLANGHAVYTADAWPVLNACWPGVSPREIEAWVGALGIVPEHPTIYAPIVLGERQLGILAVTGAGLREEDPTAFSLIADQLASALERQSLARRAAEVEILREVDRLRSELIANVSHEIRTPLGMIDVLCTSLLADDVVLDAGTQRSFLVGIKEATRRLAAMAENLLQLSQAEGGRHVLHRRITDLGRVVAAVVDRTIVQTPLHQLVNSAKDKSYGVLVDQEQIELVLSNLLNNAIKYSPGGGQIVVDLVRQNEGVILSVSDQGIGIPEAEQERIFERFYRVDSPTGRKVGGAGLGLAVCRAVVEAHGGKMWVVSHPGRGSTFYVLLPIERDASARPGRKR